MKPTQFHMKWVELSLQRDPLSDISIVEELSSPNRGLGWDNPLTTNPTGGHRYSFLNGIIVSTNHASKPCVVYGSIYSFWTRLGQVEQSGWGRPLSDEQDTEDGGRCSVFEGVFKEQREFSRRSQRATF